MLLTTNKLFGIIKNDTAFFSTNQSGNHLRLNLDGEGKPEGSLISHCSSIQVAILCFRKNENWTAELVQAKSLKRKIAPPQARNFQIAYAKFQSAQTNSICNCEVPRIVWLLVLATKKMFKNLECVRDANLAPAKLCFLFFLPHYTCNLHSNHFSTYLN